MSKEIPQGDEYMRKPGEPFVVRGRLHILSEIGNGETPAGTECEEYRAKCGMETQSWGMPAQGIPMPDFVASIKAGIDSGAIKCEGCFGTEDELSEKIAKINNSLKWPLSLSLDKVNKTVTYNMGTNANDESGGGTVRDFDSYAFPAEALSVVIGKASIEGIGSTVIKGTRSTDIEDWPYGRDDGRSEHRDNEPVFLFLTLTEKGEETNFEIQEFQDGKEAILHLIKSEKLKGNEFKLTPHGRRAVELLKMHNKELEFKYKNNVYSWLNPEVFDFGDLDDPITPSTLTLDDYYTPETSSDGDYSETRRNILHINKELAYELLSKITPGEKIVVRGSGIAESFLERAGYGYNRNENTVEKDIKNPVEVTLSVRLSENGNTLSIDIDSTSVEPKGFTIKSNIWVHPNNLPNAQPDIDD